MKNNKLIKLLIISGSFYCAINNINSENLSLDKDNIQPTSPKSYDCQENRSELYISSKIKNHIEKYWKGYAIGSGIIALITGVSNKIINDKNKEILSYKTKIADLNSEKQNLDAQIQSLNEGKESLSNSIKNKETLTNQNADLMMQNIQSNYKIDTLGKILKFEMQQYDDSILGEEIRILQNKSSLDEADEIRLAFLQEEYQKRSQADYQLEQ